MTKFKRIILDDELIERLADMALERQGTNTSLPILHQQYSETERSINNFLNAIQQGIITESTKKRLEELEQLKSEISVQIAKEEIKQPTLSREQILFWFHRLRKMDVKKLEHRRRLIDSFINSIYLFDDYMIITFNYKDGSKTITFEEIENTINGSDLAGFGAPKNAVEPKVRLHFLYKTTGGGRTGGRTAKAVRKKTVRGTVFADVGV